MTPAEERPMKYETLRNNKTFKNIEFVKQPLEELKKITGDYNFNVLIYSFGAEEYQNEFLKKFADSNPDFYFQTVSFDQTGDRKFILHPLDNHPSALANEKYAQEIYDAIVNYNLLQT